MKSPITKPAAAAVVILAVIVGIMHFSTSIDGTGVLWAKAVQNVEQANSAIFREKRIFTCDGEESPFLIADAVCYYSSKYGERDDMYSTEGMLLHQIYWLPHENVRIRVIPPLKQYERTEFNEAERAFWEQPNIKAIVELSKSKKPTPIGRKMIDGREAEGFETSEMAEIVPLQVDRGVTRCWIDIETGLPIRYETEFLTRDKFATLLTDGKPVLIQSTGYKTEWNVEIDPNIFEPNIPTDYVDIVVLESISTVHIFGRDSDDKQIEMWAQVNPDTGLMTNFYLHQIDRKIITVSTPKETYSYDQNANVVKIKDGPGLESPFRIVRFVEDLKKLANRIDGRVEEYEKFDSKLKKNVIILEVTSPRGDVKAVIDSKTKLPIRLDPALGIDLGQSFTWKSMDVSYEERLPEGIFEFVVPDGATVIRDTIETKDEITSAQIIQYAAKIYTESTEKTDKWCNTRITVVDEDMKVYRGGAFNMTNDSSKVWVGEISVMTTDSMKMAVFNEKGSRLEARLVQWKPLRGGRFREYITLDEPLHPGQKRSFVYWDGYGTPCRRTDTENRYTLTMQNNPGDCLESFILVLAPNVEIRQSSEGHTFYEEINGREVYVWQEHVSAGQKHKVTVELSKRKQE
ncbi:MAG: hypothetical protein ACYS80_18825 [Planctomycetota bacterium]